MLLLSCFLPSVTKSTFTYIKLCFSLASCEVNNCLCEHSLTLHLDTDPTVQAKVTSFYLVDFFWWFSLLWKCRPEGKSIQLLLQVKFDQREMEKCIHISDVPPAGKYFREGFWTPFGKVTCCAPSNTWIMYHKALNSSLPILCTASLQNPNNLTF